MTAWLRPGELRVGLGCMRLSTEPSGDEARAIETVHAALDAGVTVFDTARAYALSDDELGHNERLLAKAISSSPIPGVAGRVRIVTKGGMQRPGGRWVADGRARSIAGDCAASVEALNGLPIDLYLLHAPDPSVPFSTSMRALAALLDRGLVRRVGVSNVTRAQLDEALAIIPSLAAVELSLGWRDDSALKSGVVARCIERGLAVLAHRPLGGAAAHNKMARDKILRAVADRHRASPAAVALAATLDLDPAVVVLPGCSRPETARDATSAHALALALDDADRAQLAARLDKRAVMGPRPPSEYVDGEVVLLMGIQGAGKSDALTRTAGERHERLNRDERGGTMKDLHRHLDARLAAGLRYAALDNTYLTRAVRRAAIEVAWRHRLPVRGVWFDTPLGNAQVNVVLRMLAAHGRLLEPDEMARIGGPSALPPSAQHRSVRMLERPSLDEGFHTLEIVPFARRAVEGRSRAGRFIALEALVDPTSGRARDSLLAALLEGGRASASAADDDDDVARLVFAWRPNRAAPLSRFESAIKEAAHPATRASLSFAECPHPAGPPICWCRPPMPGLVLAFCVAAGVDPAKSTLVGTGVAHRSLAAALGADYLTAA